MSQVEPLERPADAVTALLHEVVCTLAPLERGAASAGEREAAAWLAGRLDELGASAEVETVEFLDGFVRQLLPLGAAGLLAGLLALSGRARIPATLVAATAALATADDANNGRRWWRRLIGRPKHTTNVVAELGDPSADRTLVLLAHHDAPGTGRVFDQSFQRALARRFPIVIERANSSLPLWWPIVGAPAAVAAGAATGRRGLVAAGVAGELVNVLLALDMLRSPIVPGANDNLSGVAVLAGIAARLEQEPLDGLQVLLASCGAEEVLQGGIYAFVERHLRPLDAERTWVVNLDTVGSPRLVMLEGEGVLWMEEYPGPTFRDLIAETASAAGVPLVRGQRARSSTDSVIPARAGYPIATITSFEPETKLLSNYHLPTDTPENLDFDTVAEAVILVEAVARRLAAAER
jgi:peptidase M28-like protein